MEPEEKLLENLGGELRRGVQVLCVLSQLQNAAYGYTLGQKIRDQGLEVDHNTLYPLLRRLEKSGLLESFWKLEEGRQRRYYRLTQSGREVLDALQGEWERMVQAVSGMLEKKEEE